MEFGARLLFSDIDWSVSAGEKWGLVGQNGVGKTTLFGLLRGAVLPSAGTIGFSAGVSFGYLAQHAPTGGSESCYEACMAVFAPLHALEGRLRALEGEMATRHEEVAEEYERLTLQFEKEGGYQTESRCKGVLTGLGLPQSLWHNPIGTLSGGERTRLELAKLLLAPPDLLLLDEPTNHLDMQAAAWLSDYLQGLRCAMVIISHDRSLLDEVTRFTARLENTRLYVYQGNYTAHRQKREIERENQEKLYTQQQKEIARQQEIIRRFHQTNTEKSVKLARSREKALEKLEPVEQVSKTKAIRLRFSPAPRSGQEVLSARGLTAGFNGRTLFAGVNLTLRAGERAMLVGPNGAGKTTLLELLPNSPAVRFGAGVKLGFYSQHHKELQNGQTLHEAVWEGNRQLSYGQVCSLLAAMLFTGEDFTRPIGSLSGGEKARVALCRLAAAPCNLLLLDEPTNHLDMESRDILEEALEHYTGTLVAVSHDRYFLNRLGTRIWALEEGGFQHFPGTYAAYKASLTEPIKQPAISKTAAAKAKQTERQEREQQKMLAARERELYARVEKLEQRRRELEEAFARPETWQNREAARALETEYENGGQELARLYEEIP